MRQKIILSDRKSTAAVVVTVAPKNPCQVAGMTGVFVFVVDRKCHIVSQFAMEIRSVHIA